MKRDVTEALEQASISLTRAREDELDRIVETVRARKLPTVSNKEEKLRAELVAKQLLLEGIDRALARVGDELETATIPADYHLAVAMPDATVSGVGATRHYEA